MTETLLAQHERNLIVLSAGRSGSSLLVNYLNSNRQIHCHGEILNPGHKIYGNVEGMDSTQLLRHVASYFTDTDATYVGAKFLNHQFEELGMSIEEILHVLRRPKVLVLYRKNLLETYLSLKIAEHTDVWYSTEAVNQISVPLDVVDFLTFANDQRRRWNESMEAVSALCPFFTLTYEQLTTNAANVMNEVFRFLELPYVSVHSDSLKQNPGDFRSKISNVQEISQAELLGAAGEFLDLRYGTIHDAT